MAMREKSGVLTLRRGPLEKEIVFDSGAVVECHSNIATETLGRFLVASGRINENSVPARFGPTRSCVQAAIFRSTRIK